MKKERESEKRRERVTGKKGKEKKKAIPALVQGKGLGESYYAAEERRSRTGFKKNNTAHCLGSSSAGAMALWLDNRKDNTHRPWCLPRIPAVLRRPCFGFPNVPLHFCSSRHAVQY